MSFLCSMLAPLQGGLFLESSSPPPGIPGQPLPVPVPVPVTVPVTVPVLVLELRVVGRFVLAESSPGALLCASWHGTTWGRRWCTSCAAMRPPLALLPLPLRPPLHPMLGQRQPPPYSHYSTPGNTRTLSQGGAPGLGAGSLKSLSLISVIPQQLLCPSLPGLPPPCGVRPP